MAPPPTRRPPRTILALAAAIALAAGAGLAPVSASLGQDAASPPVGTPVAVTATPLPLDARDPSRAHVGRLEFAGALRLESTDPYFGGISGLITGPDGREFLAVTDRGTWLAGRFLYEDGRLTGVDAVQRAPILDWRGAELGYGANDAEGLTLSAGRVVVSFEGFHRIWRYALPDADHFETVFRQSALAFSRFDGWADQPANGGIEAIAALPAGNLLAISEEARTDTGAARAWIVGPEGAEDAAWPVTGDYKPTGAAILDNGDLLVLERRFSVIGGVSARIRRAALADLRAGRTDGVETVAVLDPPINVDNMEALAVVPEDGGYRLILASDDNFNVLQRSIVMNLIWRSDPAVE